MDFCKLISDDGRDIELDEDDEAREEEPRRRRPRARRMVQLDLLDVAAVGEEVER